MTSNAYHWPRAARTLCLVAGALVAGGCAAPPTGTSLGTLNGDPTAPFAPVPAPAAGPATFAGAAPGDSAPTPADGAAAAPVPVPVDPLQPEVAVDLNSKAAHADLWIRVRRGFAMPDLDSDLVHDREQWYATRPDYVARMTERGGRYLFHIVEELERRAMPTELALLPFIESAFNPQALSTAKASGMWQFIPSTGKTYALTQNIFRDDRRDVLASTRAALDYLQKLHDLFGDWHLALAAYNWGEGSVQRAIAKNQRAGLPTDYPSLNMPNETRYYVPKLQAVKNIIARPEAFALSLPPLANHPYFLSVPIVRDIDVSVAARLAGLGVDEFKTLNPQMNKPVILAAGTPQVLLPYDNASSFVNRLAEHRGPLASWTAWVAPKTLRPADAAREVGMSEAELREVNRIPPRMLVKAGSTLLVPRAEHRQADVSGQVAEHAMMALAPDRPPLRRVSFKASRHDSVAAVAQRYHVGAAQLAAWNRVGSLATTFRPGQTVLVYLPNHGPVRGVATGADAAKHAVATPVAAVPAARVAALAAPPSHHVSSGKAAKAPVRRAVAAAGGAARSANRGSVSRVASAQQPTRVVRR